MTTADARKRRHERDMADAHAAARARDAKARAAARHARFMAAIDRILARDPQTAADSTPPPQEDPMPTITRTITVRLDPESMALLTEIRDRLPEPTGSGTCMTCGTELYAGDPLDCRKHEPAPADDLPGEPVEPGDLRAGDRVEFTYRGKRYEGALVGSTRRRVTPITLELAGLMVTFEGGWAGGISDVRLIDRAPREDEEPDEAGCGCECHD